MSYKRTVDSIIEIISMADAKLHLRVDHDDDDALIDAIRKSARKWCENYTERSFFTQTWVRNLDLFPASDDVIELLNGPVQSVTTLKYFNESEVLTTLVEGTDYRVDTNSQVARIEPIDSWPDEFDKIDAVEITYKAGEANIEDVDEEILTAVKVFIADLYENRETFVKGTQVNMINTVRLLLNQFKVYNVIK